MENEVYQKAFDFLMSDKRITQKINAAVKKKKGTIADLTLKQKNAWFEMAPKGIISLNKEDQNTW